jgi:hypothetical protein
MCDAESVDSKDWVVTDHVQTTYVGETMYSMFNPAHKWFYLKDQMPDEVTLLKIYDNRDLVTSEWTHDLCRAATIETDANTKDAYMLLLSSRILPMHHPGRALKLDALYFREPDVN